jgi:hypothetical protein
VKQIFVSSQSSAGEGTQPSGYERQQTKKITTSFDGLRNIFAGKTGRRFWLTFLYLGSQY